MGISLGRQFRALKLRFVPRAYGLERLRNMIRNHIDWSCALCEKLHAMQGFEIVTEPLLSLFSFRNVPSAWPISMGSISASSRSSTWTAVSMYADPR